MFDEDKQIIDIESKEVEVSNEENVVEIETPEKLFL